jgi:hypothetical protein
VLDWVRERATGRSYADDVARLWQALGCTRDAYVAVDGTGLRWPGGGLARRHATGPGWPSSRWTAAGPGGREAARPSTGSRRRQAAYPFLAVGRLPSSITTHAGFGYHWWPMDDAGTG